MTGSALEAFASASRALRRLSVAARLSEDDATRSELSALRAQYPEAFAEFPDPSTGTADDLARALASVGSHIALAMVSDLARHALEQYRHRRYRDALRVFGLVLVLAPDSPAAAVMYASALELTHPRAEFLKPARRANVLAPLGADGWKLVMRGSLAAGNYTGAQNQAKRHLLLAPASGDGWLILSRAYFRGGRPEDAYPTLLRGRALAPENLDVQRALTRCLFRLGRFAEARLAIEHAARLGADGPEHVFEYARVARSAGEFDLASTLLDKLVDEFPTYRDNREILELTATTADLRGSAP
jgi:tetratricopeptide (TPR) repeat protein